MFIRNFVLVCTLSAFPLFSDPIPPSNLTLVPDVDTVLLSWDNNDFAISGFKIYRDDDFLQLLDKNSTSYLDKNLIPNTNYTYTIKSTDDNLTAPYTNGKFKPVLNDSKLQWQSSIDDIYKNIYDFDGVSKEYFYLSKNSIMNLKTQSFGNKRVELRQTKTWNNESHSKIVADIKCTYPKNIKEYTWMQVFDMSANRPLLRLIWRKSREHKENHLWAFFNAIEDEYKVDLGLNPDRFFNAQISISNQKVQVIIDNNILLDENISHWRGENYFKTGVYLSGKINNSIDESKSKEAQVKYRSLQLN